jgi:hypothetical protein
MLAGSGGHGAHGAHNAASVRNLDLGAFLTVFCRVAFLGMIIVPVYFFKRVWKWRWYHYLMLFQSIMSLSALFDVYFFDWEIGPAGWLFLPVVTILMSRDIQKAKAAQIPVRDESLPM